MISILFKTVLIVAAIFQPNAEAFNWKFWKNEDYINGTLKIHNNCDEDIFVEKFSHNLSDEKYSTTKENFSVKALSHSQVFNYRYQTGLFAMWDYWYIQAVLNGSVYSTSSNIRCNIGSKDYGGTTVLRVTVEKEDAHFQVVPPNTSECTFNLYTDSNDQWGITMYSIRAVNNVWFSLKRMFQWTKKGFFTIHNNCGTDLFVSEVSHHSHRLSDDSVYDETIEGNVTIKAYEYSKNYSFIYRTNEDSMRDYWHIRVRDQDGSMLRVHPDFWCNVTSSKDGGSTTVLQVTLTNYTREFKVVPPSAADRCIARFI